MIKQISIYNCDTYSYPSSFRPSIDYPEYLFSELSKTENRIYDSIRNSFILLGLDSENIGKDSWNPLGSIIQPGNNVLIKPNLVMDVNMNSGGDTDCLYTQPSLVAAVIDYVLIALKGEGSVTIGDAPMQECNFDNLLATSGYDKLVSYYKEKNQSVDIVDFRELKSDVKNGVYYSTLNSNAKGKIVSLGTESAFYNSEKLGDVRITNYDPRILPTHHHDDIQEYYVSQYILDADVIINMPKPKTHRKAGVTISLKNFVGANVRKEFLPHHTMGSLAEGGDEYKNKSYLKSYQSKLLDQRNILRAEKKYLSARLIQYVIKGLGYFLKLTNQKYSEGSWYGNKTISRTITDLNKIIFFADKNGVMHDQKQRKLFIIADMVVSGEKEGPVNPSPKKVGIIAMGDDPLLFDESIATIMGFDINKIPTFEAVRKYSGKYSFFSEEDVEVIKSNISYFDGKKASEINKEYLLNYEPTSGWKGHIERRVSD